MDLPDPEDEFLSEIYQGAIKPALDMRPRMDFKPWLKPRKHYIRLRQWCHETRSLMKQIKVRKGGELRYLGLPGEDLIDIRVLKGICQRAKVTLRYLGFDSSLRSPQLNLSRHEVNSEEFIHSSSLVIGDQIEALVSRKSMAYRFVDSHAPFDVINLDLCDSITARAEKGSIPNLEALRTLCDVQIERRGQPWLLFVATRTLRVGLDQRTKQKLFDRLLRNIGESAEFGEILGRELSLAEQSIRDEMSGESLGDDEWFDLYVLSLSKWLLHYMVAHNYSVSVTLLPSYSYSVKGGVRDMASLAFLMEPALEPRQDSTGLTSARRKVKEAVNEMRLAQKVVEEVAKIVDLDHRMKADLKLKEEMFTKCAALLAPLRYDMDAYKRFAFDD